jgi:hypothetical protein
MAVAIARHQTVAMAALVVAMVSVAVELVAQERQVRVLLGVLIILVLVLMVPAVAVEPPLLALMAHRQRVAMVEQEFLHL